MQWARAKGVRLTHYEQYGYGCQFLYDMPSYGPRMRQEHNVKINDVIIKKLLRHNNYSNPQNVLLFYRNGFILE